MRDGEACGGGGGRARHGLRSISLPVWILLGAFAGIVAGIAFGERTSILQPIGEAYARLLEIAVYPYILCSLLHGLGRLTPRMAWRLLASGWYVYAFLWLATLGSIWLIAQAIPTPPLPSVLTPEALQPRADFLALLIPSNVIEALGQNYMPAVAVFAIFYGVAIQRVERKDVLIQVLHTLQAASATIWSSIARVAPIGVFALMADTAGSIQPDHLGGVLFYVALFLIGTVILTFVVLPLALSAIAPVGYREFLAELQSALILSTMTISLALPFIMKVAERVTALAGCPQNEERNDILEANLSLSYVLAQLGNYFVYLLVLYGAYAYRTRPTAAEQLLLPLWSLLAGFGSPTAAVDGVKFLASWLGLPPDVLNLFLATWPITRYGQVALSVMGFGFVNVIVPLIYFRKLRFRPRRAVAAAAASLVLLLAVMVGGRWLAPALLPQAGDPRPGFTLDPQLTESVAVTLHRETPAGGEQGQPQQELTLAAIQASGVLRVGYNPNVIPFSYWNKRGELVGFDIAFAYQLAKDIGVRLELVPFDWQFLSNDLIHGRFDIAMAGLYVTKERLQTLTVTSSYFESPIALIVHSEHARQFLSRSAILAMPKLRLVVFDNPVLVPLAQRLFPAADLRIVHNYDNLPAMAGSFDAAIWTLQQSGAWAAAHPGFTAVAPSGMGSPFLFAYLLPPGAEDFRRFVDHWMELHARDGFRKSETDYWLDGKPRSDEHHTRWNLFDALQAGVATGGAGRP